MHNKNPNVRILQFWKWKQFKKIKKQQCLARFLGARVCVWTLLKSHITEFSLDGSIHSCRL